MDNYNNDDEAFKNIKPLKWYKFYPVTLWILPLALGAVGFLAHWIIKFFT